MSMIVSLSGLRKLLSFDLGPSVQDSNAFDGWFSSFVNKPAVGVADLSFDAFSALPYAKSSELSVGINAALQAAKAASGLAKPQGSLRADGERQLTEGSEFWRGTAGNDKVLGLGGNDALVLGAGNDWVNAGFGNDLVFGEGGDDSIIGGAGDDMVFGGSGRDVVHGWKGNDLIFGGTGNDGLYGNEGNDTIYGGDGSDYICGGSGNDLLTGGRGADTFAFRGQAPNSVTVITDFQVRFDKQLITAGVANDGLSINMIKSYDDGLMIDFSQGRALYYEGVFDRQALFDSLDLFL
jgi:Ca2+-binding RTX toxin-like protein